MTTINTIVHVDTPPPGVAVGPGIAVGVAVATGAGVIVGVDVGTGGGVGVGVDSVGVAVGVAAGPQAASRRMAAKAMRARSQRSADASAPPSSHDAVLVWVVTASFYHWTASTLNSLSRAEAVG